MSFRRIEPPSEYVLALLAMRDRLVPRYRPDLGTLQAAKVIAAFDELEADGFITRDPPQAKSISSWLEFCRAGFDIVPKPTAIPVLRYQPPSFLHAQGARYMWREGLIPHPILVALEEAGWIKRDGSKRLPS